MQVRLADLRRKEVVNIADGQRLGCVEDVLLDTGSGRILALIVPGPCRFPGLFCPGEVWVIRWECVRRIGEDLILVEKHGEPEKQKRCRRLSF